MSFKIPESFAYSSSLISARRARKNKVEPLVKPGSYHFHPRFIPLSSQPRTRPNPEVVRPYLSPVRGRAPSSATQLRAISHKASKPAIDQAGCDRCTVPEACRAGGDLLTRRSASTRTRVRFVRSPLALCEVIAGVVVLPRCSMAWRRYSIERTAPDADNVQTLYRTRMTHLGGRPWVGVGQTWVTVGWAWVTVGRAPVKPGLLGKSSDSKSALIPVS